MSWWKTGKALHCQTWLWLLLFFFFLFSRAPARWPQQQQQQRRSPCRLPFSPVEKQKYCQSWKSISCLGGGGGGGGGGKRLRHYVAWKMLSCLLHETQSSSLGDYGRLLSHISAQPSIMFSVGVCARPKMIESLTNHLRACLLYAVGFWISSYGECLFPAARATQLFCLQPHFARSLLFFSVWLCWFTKWLLFFLGNALHPTFAGFALMGHCKTHYETVNWREGPRRIYR